MIINEERVLLAEFEGLMKWSYVLPKKSIHCDVPHYDTLDDFNRLEEKLTDVQWLKYMSKLNQICSKQTGLKRNLFHADVKMRKEAILEVINL